MTLVLGSMAVYLAGTPILLQAAEPLPPERSGLERVQSLIQEGRFSKAEEDARALCGQAERVHGFESAEVANVLDRLSEALRQGGKAGEPELLEVCRRAVAIRETTGSLDHPAYASSLYQLGCCYFSNGDYARARPFLKRALEIREARLEANHADVASSLLMVGALLSESGDHAAAKPLLERAVAIRESALGDGSPWVAEGLNALATVLVRMGDYPAAESMYSRALDIWKTNWGPEHPKVGTCLNNLATLLAATGDYEGSLAFTEKALRIRMRALGPDHEMVAWTLANIGMNLAALGRIEEARNRYRSAIAIQTKRFGEDSEEVGWTLKRLADTYMETGDFPEARRVLERATGNLEHGLGKDHPDLAEALASLATSSAALGDTATGNELHDRALHMLEIRLGPDHPEVGFTLTQYARGLARIPASEPALETALRGEEISREHLRLTCRSFPERAALAYAAARPAGGRLAVSILAKAPGARPETVARVWDSLIRSRTLVLDEVAARHRFAVETLDPGTKLLGDALGAARRRLASLLVAGARGESGVRYRANLGRARQETEHAERDLAAKSAAYGLERQRARLGLREVASSIPPGAALVAYAAAGDGPHISYVAFILTGAEAAPELVSVADGRTLDAAISRWIADVHHGGSGGTVGSTRATVSRVSGKALSELVWAPVSKRLAEIRRVFIVPDGAVHLVNFAALPAERGEYLIEAGPVFHYLSAERDLVEIAEAPRLGSGMLALGDPEFDLGGVSPLPRKRSVEPGVNTDCPELSSVHFQRLPSSGPEVRDVVRVWSERDRTTVLLGRDATESAFKANAPGRRILHLATHGFFLGGNCWFAPRFSRGIGGTAPPKSRRPRQAASDNPIHLSGLALAGANQRASARIDGEDGILTAEEIAAVDLTGVEWAVLSACDTGRGRIQAGEGVLGMRRAFQVAGARTVIMSLWAVEDESARQWMRALYEERVTGSRDTADSATWASLRVLRERRARSLSTEPFYWASFVATGDWR